MSPAGFPLASLGKFEDVTDTDITQKNMHKHERFTALSIATPVTAVAGGLNRR